MPTFSSTGHDLQFGNNSPTVSIVGSDLDGYIIYDMSTSGTFYQFAPNTKYFALQIIFDSPFATTPAIVINPANATTAEAFNAAPGIEFYVDQTDVTTSYFKISGISSSTPLLGAEVLMWSYQVSGTQIGASVGTVTSVATTSRLTGGPITTTGTLDLAVSGVTAGTKNGLTFDAYGRITATPSGHLIADGYTIDLSAGVTTDQILKYNGSSFVAADANNVELYWDYNTTWATIYAKINTIVTNGGSPVVTLDSSYTQTIPSGTYTGNNINNTTFFSPYGAGITVAAGATITGNVILNLVNVQLTCDGYLTQPNQLVNVEMVGLAQIYNTHATDAVFPQMNGGAGANITNGFANPTGAFFGTDGGPIFDIKTANTYYIYITNSPGGLTGTITGKAVLGGAGSYQITGDGTSLSNISSANLAGTATFVSGYPSAYTEAGLVSFIGHIKIDGYTIDLSAGALTNQVLAYNGTSFIAETVARLDTAQTYTKSQNVSGFALTDGATINTDASQSNVFTVTLAGTGRTLANPTNLVAGGTYLWIIRQDSGGSKTITTYGTLFKFPGGTTPTLTTTGSAVDMISAVYDGTQLNCVFQADFR